MARLMRFAAVVVVAITVVLSGSLPRKYSCSDADQATAKGCYDSFLSAFAGNLTHLPPFDMFISHLGNILNHYGPQGIGIVCSYTTKVDTCLGALKNTSCTKFEAFEKMYHLGEDDAVQYSFDFPVRDYICKNAGQFFPHWQCFFTVQSTHAANFTACAGQFNHLLHNGVDPCTVSGVYLGCVTNVYAQLCGAALKPYICEANKIALGFTEDYTCKLPECSTI